MSKITGLAAVALMALSLAAPATAEPPKAEFRITNDAHQVVQCNFLVNGATRNYLKVHQGKAYFDSFDPRTLLQLVCMRGAQDVYGPLKTGVAYRFVSRDGNRVAVVEGAGE